LSSQDTVLKNGLTLKDTILPSYEEDDEVVDMKSFCTKFVDAMGVDAEGPFVELGILPHLLKCKCIINSLGNRSNDSFVVTDFTLALIEEGSGEGASGSSEKVAARSTSEAEEVLINLLLRPGHYDLLYEQPAHIIIKMQALSEAAAASSSSSSTSQKEVSSAAANERGRESASENRTVQSVKATAAPSGGSNAQAQTQAPSPKEQNLIEGEEPWMGVKIAQVEGITSCSREEALRMLQQHKFDVDETINSFFEAPASSSSHGASRGASTNQEASRGDSHLSDPSSSRAHANAQEQPATTSSSLPPPPPAPQTNGGMLSRVGKWLLG